MRQLVKTYYALTKPGIIYGNAITATAGFLLVSGRHIHLGLLIGMLAGLSLIIASACVFNNYIDRDIDRKMARTKNRAIVSKKISSSAATIYATILGILGGATLAIFTNYLTLSIALSGFFVYVVLYGFFKRRSVWGTVVGSLAGAVPPVVGYCAVTNRLDAGALILFLILVFWQMPHFYSIAIYRFSDYKAADLPVLPVKRGLQKTKIYILLYIVAFIGATAALTVLSYAGYVYLVVAVLAGLAWLRLGINGFMVKDSTRWARRMFRFSLIVITVVSIMISLDAILP